MEQEEQTLTFDSRVVTVVEVLIWFKQAHEILKYEDFKTL